MNQKTNPFALPGFGQTGELSQNPLLASMEMMSQAWHNLAGTGMLNQPPVSAALSTEDLDRRINDLRAVENWLRVNMSMLSSSIQALEVQRATISTIKSFANVPGAPDDAHDNPSPLEVALGIKPSGQAKIKTPAQAHGEPEPSAPAGSSQTATPEGAPDMAAMAGVAQGWWDMLQKQFDTMASMTAAGMQATQAAQDFGQAAPAKTTARRTASTPSAKTAAPAKTATKRSATKAAKKAAAKSASKRAGG